HVLIARLPAGDDARAREARIVQRILQRKRARHALANGGRIADRADFVVLAERIAEVERAACLPATLLLAITVGAEGVDPGVKIERARRARGMALPAPAIPRPGFDTGPERILRRLAVGGNEIDRAAELRPAETQRIAALVDF